jgi:hypothetical protein
MEREGEKTGEDSPGAPWEMDGLLYIEAGRRLDWRSQRYPYHDVPFNSELA